MIVASASFADHLAKVALTMENTDDPDIAIIIDAMKYEVATRDQLPKAREDVVAGRAG